MLDSRQYPSRASSYAGLAELAAEGKAAAKAIPGSSYVRDGKTMVMKATGTER